VPACARGRARKPAAAVPLGETCKASARRACRFALLSA
jgi:hypothetical protein